VERHARNRIPVLVSACVAAAMAASSLGCSTQPRLTAVPVARPDVGVRPMQLLAPVERTSKRDAIVRLVGRGNVTCTGTLIADDRVLTAHHCVSVRDKRGRISNQDMAPEEIQVELGTEDFPWGEVRVRAIVAPQCGYTSGDGDIAILVLERHLIGMPTVPVRIESAPELKEELHVHGFGRCGPSDAPFIVKDSKRGEGETVDWIQPGAIHLRFRDSGPIESIGVGQFTAKATICPGDSGGPVYSSKEDLIGVVAASVMIGDPTSLRTSVFTRVDKWGALFSAAEEISNGASPSELPPYGDCNLPSQRPAR
jgi:V8-like Glu-specific endopeptidase